jgi:hypothetical protein
LVYKQENSFTKQCTKQAHFTREKERDDLWVIREREEERKRGKKDLGGGGPPKNIKT